MKERNEGMLFIHSDALYVLLYVSVNTTNVNGQITNFVI